MGVFDYISDEERPPPPTRINISQLDPTRDVNVLRHTIIRRIITKCCDIRAVYRFSDFSRAEEFIKAA